MTNLTRSSFQPHPFHLVSPSPWPILTCVSLLALTTAGVLAMHGFTNARDFLPLAFLSLICSMSFWFRDVISEATYLGNHTLAVQRGLNMGVALFIVSEALFFLAIFWTFFHSALSPTVELGAQWPPMGIEAVNPFELPLLNTVLLLSSGVCLKWKSFLKIKKLDNNPLKHLALFTSKVPSTKRIGPHNHYILCILIGSLLGDGNIERNGNGSRFCFYQSGEHVEYILWLHSILLKHGYCKENTPIIETRIIHGKLNYYCRFKTFTYSSFNWIYDEFYPSWHYTDENRKKTLPSWIEDYLSPVALAIWIMDGGEWIKNRGLIIPWKLSSDCFTLTEVQFLVYILEKKYNLNLAIHSTGAIDQYNIYFPKQNLPTLIPIVLPYMDPYFLYNLNMVKPNISWTRYNRIYLKYLRYIRYNLIYLKYFFFIILFYNPIITNVQFS